MAKPKPQPPPVPLTAASIADHYREVPREGWRAHHQQWHYWRAGQSLCEKFTVRVLNRNNPKVQYPTVLAKAMLVKHPACKDCLTVKRQPTAVPVPRTSVATMAGAKGSTQTPTRATVAEPELTEGLALEFVKLLHAGLPGPEALWVLAPAFAQSLDSKDLGMVLRRWGRSPACTAAAATLNRGAWADLEAETRLRIALDKHYAELGYWLYTTDWSTADPKRSADAREALSKKLEGRDEADDTPMMAFLRAVQSGEVRFDKPAQLAGLGQPPPVPLDLGLGLGVKRKGES